MESFEIPITVTPSGGVTVFTSGPAVVEVADTTGRQFYILIIFED